jgi:hypothetical protein
MPTRAEVVAFLGAGTPSVCVGFGSMPTCAPKDAARLANEATRAQTDPLLKRPPAARRHPSATVTRPCGTAN